MSGHVTATQQQRRHIRFTVISIIVVITAFMGLFLNKVLSTNVLSKDQLRHFGVVIFDQPRVLSPFELRDQNGEVFNNQNLVGKKTLLFFGFTHCPDICPTTLSDIAWAKSKLNNTETENFQVAMVTLDPARDSAEQLKQYVGYFDNQMLGLGGEFKSIMTLSRNVNIAFQKVPQGDSYTIDHSGQLILVDSYGNYAGFIKHPDDRTQLKTALNSILAKHLL